MNEADLNAMVLELQRTTPLGRLGYDEAHVVFARLAALGHTVSPSKGLVPGEPEGVHKNYLAGIGAVANA